MLRLVAYLYQFSTTIVNISIFKAEAGNSILIPCILELSMTFPNSLRSWGHSETHEETYITISSDNNQVPFHLRWKETMIKILKIFWI